MSGWAALDHILNITTMSVHFGHSLRSQFYLRGEMTFLNNGSFGSTPRVVVDAQRAWQERMEHQPIEFVQRILTPSLRRAAGTLAEFMGARGEDLAFVENASTGVANVLHSLIPRLKPGDELLSTSHVYNAMRQCMKHICSITGAHYTEVPVPFPISGPQQVLDALVGAMNERTRFVLVDHITSPTGVTFPVHEIVDECHRRGILVLIDGAHAPGMVELDLNTLNADWYTGNFHKWLFAPKGSAFLWTHPEHQAWTHPVVPSHGYMQGYLAEFDYLGTKDWSAYLAAVDGLEYFQQLGPSAVRTYNNSLALQAQKMLVDTLPQALPAPPEMLASLASIVLPLESEDAFVEATRLHDRLWDEYRIEVPVFPFGNKLLLRVAVQVYNEQSEYQVLCSALREIFGNA